MRHSARGVATIAGTSHGAIIVAVPSTVKRVLAMATNSHRSYRPINACGNKLLQKRWDQSYYDEHRRLVGSLYHRSITNGARVLLPKAQSNALCMWSLDHGAKAGLLACSSVHYMSSVLLDAGSSGQASGGQSCPQALPSHQRQSEEAAGEATPTLRTRAHLQVCLYGGPVQLKRERLDEIERDNLTLLTKMQHTMATEGGVDHRNTYCHHR